MSFVDPYNVLEIDMKADDEAIEAAYRRLARQHHPDVSDDPESNAKMIALNRAREQLRDPVQRAAVDRVLKRTTGKVAWVAAASAHARTAQDTAARVARPPDEPTSWTDRDSRPAWPGGVGEPASDAPGRPSRGRSGPWAAGRVQAVGSEPADPGGPDQHRAAGPPPGHPSGSVLNFGRYAGWSLGEIARTEVAYLEWLDRMPIGRIYRAEIDWLLRSTGRRSGPNGSDQGRGGAFRRR